MARPTNDARDVAKKMGGSMTLTEEQLTELRAAALPLMQWINDNCHPHVSAIIDSEHIELVEGLATARRTPRDDLSELESQP